jgi:GNAT superfamily N-acetyltransferase
MAALQLMIHAPGAPGLRWFGLGPGLRPTRGLWKLQRLFNKHAFWAQQRSHGQLRRLLAGSTVVVSLWHGKRLVGFGRASSDGIYRAVLWDVVVAGDLHGQGLGRRVVEALLARLPDDHQQRRLLPAAGLPRRRPPGAAGQASRDPRPTLGRLFCLSRAGQRGAVCPKLYTLNRIQECV